jgi:hypothetical protein
MKIQHFCAEYTRGRVYFKDILSEIVEWFEELIKWNKEARREEWADVIAFLQMWLWNRFKINGELWNSGLSSFNKFISRRQMWEKIYAAAGIKEKCTHCRNYARKEKVVEHLANFGVSKEKAEKIFEKVVNSK